MMHQFAMCVHDYLNEIFPNRCIGRRGAMEWLARSPDLTLLDYFMELLEKQCLL